MQEIPLVFSDAPYLIMKTPTVFPNYIIKNDTEGNKSGVVIFNNTTLGIHCTQTMQTKYTGKHCNSKISHEMLNQGCVCWGNLGIGTTNLSLLHTVVVNYRTSNFTKRKVFSNKFNLDIFQDK